MGDQLVVDFDHHARYFLDNRLTEWAKLRETPVAYTHSHGGYWVVSGFEEVSRVSRDEATFTSRVGPHDGVECVGIAGIPRPRGIPPAGIAEADPALHQALRRVLNPYLLPAAVEALRPFAEELTTWFLDQRIEHGRMDMVTDFTNPVPAIVTMRLIGLPCEQWQHYAELFHATVAYRPGSPEYTRAISRVPEMMAGLLEEVRARRHKPRDDMLSALVSLEGEDGRALDDDVVSSILWNLVGGGLDTTTSLTSLSLHHLAIHPDLREQLRGRPELMATATEEFLRYFSVNETLSRTVTADTELGGQKLSRGDAVLLSWISANHDESVFDRAGEVVLDRSPNRHLAFGVGAHRCIGMHVARTLFQVMVSAVLDRIPDFEVSADGTRFYQGNPMLAGVVSMPVTFAPGPRVGPVSRPF
jgi:cytochrome P450